MMCLSWRGMDPPAPLPTNGILPPAYFDSGSSCPTHPFLVLLRSTARRRERDASAAVEPPMPRVAAVRYRADDAMRTSTVLMHRLARGFGIQSTSLLILRFGLTRDVCAAIRLLARLGDDIADPRLGGVFRGVTSLLEADMKASCSVQTAVGSI
jgi:hypothetical protein